ncbi:hypothetical protein P280DRAFT_154471 [Massarina eburnea CBS 473.64]|uniref:Uncharacterized protein n=1 Tax=Massarina eburnea CBS 473.64 TaxID=1395130 RepID=A0A6A6RP50_9PLEO|nr:hypothetical protein P280DRAFT_154471 [Massarina eburnea CBS 473.64]
MCLSRDFLADGEACSCRRRPRGAQLFRFGNFARCSISALALWNLGRPSAKQHHACMFSLSETCHVRLKCEPLQLHLSSIATQACHWTVTPCQKTYLYRIILDQKGAPRYTCLVSHLHQNIIHPPPHPNTSHHLPSAKGQKTSGNSGICSKETN